MAFQQGAICGTLVLSNNQIGLWTRATALGHGAIFSTISFSIYKFLLGVVTANNSQSCLMRAAFPSSCLSFAGIAELCNVMYDAWHLSSAGAPQLGSVLHPIHHSSKRSADVSISFPFLFLRCRNSAYGYCSRLKLIA